MPNEVAEKAPLTFHQSVLDELERGRAIAVQIEKLKLELEATMRPLADRAMFFLVGSADEEGVVERVEALLKVMPDCQQKSGLRALLYRMTGR